MARKDLLTRLADAGEDAIARLAETPGADRIVGAMTTMRERVDELQKRVRGLDELERRVAALEARLAEPPVKAETARRRTPAPKTAAAGTTRSRRAATGASGTGSTRRRTKPPTGERGETPPGGRPEGDTGSSASTGGDSPG